MKNFAKLSLSYTLRSMSSKSRMQNFKGNSIVNRFALWVVTYPLEFLQCAQFCKIQIARNAQFARNFEIWLKNIIMCNLHKSRCMSTRVVGVMTQLFDETYQQILKCSKILRQKFRIGISFSI